MKQNIVTILISLAILLAGCSKDEIAGTTVPNKQTATFTVTTDATATRAEVTDLTRYIMEVYEGATATGTPAEHIEQNNGTFSITLKENTAHTILFWADYGTPDANTANEYNAADLKAVKLQGTTSLRAAAKAAWSGMLAFTSDDSAPKNKTVTLTYSVAQINFKQSAQPDFIEDNNTLAVSFKQSYSLNVADRKVADIASTPTLTEIAITSKTAKELGTCYVIARGDNSEEKTLMEIETTFGKGSGDAAEAAKPLSNVPMRAGFRTNITGAYSDVYSSTVTMDCDETWETPEYEKTNYKNR